MHSPAFIVDGFTEKEIIHKICPGRPVRRTDLNGKNVSIAAIAKKIASLIRLLGNKHYPIFVIVDKEHRGISFENMAKQLVECIEKEGITDQDVRVSVADMMIENWIVADWENLETNKPKPYDTENINGASLIKKHKGTYGKTTDGVDMFCSANPQKIYENSASFRSFVDCMNDIDCHYLKFEK